MGDIVTIALIALLPLAGFALLGLFGKWIGRYAGLVGTALLLGSTGIAVHTAYRYFFVTGKVNGVYQTLMLPRIKWLEFSSSLSIDMSILLDPLSVMMIVVVTLVSLMVHIYSIDYLKGEKRYATYFSYLALFTFSMLGLVLSSNIFQIYIFWELVGVSSFLLIGFYYDRPSAVAASKKAFIVTRFADLGFLIGILILSFYSGTLDFGTMIQRLTDTGSNELRTAVNSSFLGVSALTWGLTLVFMGGAGKSAMIPLHIWLPDAMEGPTPVSALIHAATMVVAGVYLVARLFPVYSTVGQTTQELIAWVGGLSALIAAIIACTQTDIKRVLAYSTMSQIGYMMFSLGISGYASEHGLGYSASLFHLFTHAFFKALLFLAAGVVIHYVHSNEMKDMGGLRKYMPVTHLTFLIACLAIAGIPPFSGFFSKEEILLAAYESNKPIFYIGLITSGLTAFYMFRLYFSIFWKKEFRSHGHTHNEGGILLLLPLVFLSLMSLVSGFIPFSNYVTADQKPLATALHLEFSIAPVVAALLGISIAFFLYKKENSRPDSIAKSIGNLYRLAYEKFYIDEIYLFITKKIIFNLIATPAAWFDKNVVDGAVNEGGDTTQWISERIRKLQSGKLQHYAIWFLVSTLGLVVLFIYLIG